MNIDLVRQDFAILARNVNGYPLVYLDNAATTQKPKAVTDGLQQFYTSLNSNIHRGVHHLSQEATAAYEDSRSYAAEFMGAGTGYTVLFTKGTTESVNLVASCFSALLPESWPCRMSPM